MVEHCFIRCQDDVFRLVKIIRRDGDEVVVEDSERGEAKIKQGECKVYLSLKGCLKRPAFLWYWACML